MFMRLLSATLLLMLTVSAQSTPDQQPTTPATSTQPGGMQVEPMDETPTFRVRVVERLTKAVNYRHRGGATAINFQGTELMPKASGEAKVESKQGYIEVEAEFDEIGKPTKFGNEYLTYVLWAVTPEGRATNLGELILNGNRSKLNVTTELQAFGLIVTAEPYFGVTTPSDLVVMENVIRPDTVGGQAIINAKYELIERGGYKPSSTNYDPVVFNTRLPLEYYEAQNAKRIADAVQAQRYASSSYDRAAKLLKQAEDYTTRKNVERKPISTVSREAVQTFEDARLIALRRQEEERQETERRLAAERQAATQAAADEEARRRAEAESQRSAEEQRRLEAEKTAEQRRLEAAESARLRAEEEKRRQEAEAGRQAALTQQQQAEELARLRESEAQRQRLAAEESERRRLQAEREKEELRARLLQQLNTILETRDTARGLIVNMSDVLFDFGKTTLRSGAREKLAKISGVLMTYPELKIEVEGHTDSVGSEEYNEALSEKRALAVVDYLTKQGVSHKLMTYAGLGESAPVADNRSAAGRQQNRRVELVVSGEVIGTKIGGQQQQEPPTESTEPPPQPR